MKKKTITTTTNLPTKKNKSVNANRQHPPPPTRYPSHELTPPTDPPLPWQLEEECEVILEQQSQRPATARGPLRRRRGGPVLAGFAWRWRLPVGCAGGGGGGVGGERSDGGEKEGLRFLLLPWSPPFPFLPFPFFAVIGTHFLLLLIFCFSSSTPSSCPSF